MSVRISIVVALGPGRSAEMIASLRHTTYPKENYEVIIEEGLNPSENRNRGVKKARGEIIALLDDDAYIHPNALALADQFFLEHPEIDIVGGPQLTPKTDKGFAKLSGVAIESAFGTYKMSARYAPRTFTLHADETMLTSANCYVRKKAYEQLGGFNTLLFPGEDPEFFARAKRQGCGIAYHPELIVHHKRRDSFAAFFKQFYNYGKFRPAKESFAKGNGVALYYTPMFFAVYLIPLLLLGIFVHWIYFLPLALYLVIALVFSVYEIIKRRNILLISLPFFYLSIHVAYGIGLFVGLLKPARRITLALSPTKTI